MVEKRSWGLRDRFGKEGGVEQPRAVWARPRRRISVSGKA